MQGGTTPETHNLDANTTQTITDAVLLSRIIKLIDQPTPAPWWRRALRSQLFSLAFSLILGFSLTGLVGTYLTSYYNRKQAELDHQRTINLKELEHERSFADELNKTRVAKIAEVYERFFVYEASVEDAMEGINVKSDSPGQVDFVLAAGREKDLKDALERSRDARKELLAVLNKNRAWLEDDNYNKIQRYAKLLYEDKFARQTRQGIERWEEARAQAMTSLNEMRGKLLKK